MKKITRKVPKEERKDNLNEPLVIIEQDSSLTKKRVISYPFNKEKRDSAFSQDAKRSSNVGPGSYNIINRKNPPQNVISKNSRFPKNDNKNPGVGEYNVAESEINVEYSAPKYQIPKAERKNPFEVSKEKRGIPGIGNYKLGVKYPKNFYIEEKVERFHTSKSDRPGVGEYDINDAELKLKKKTGISTNKAERKDPFEVNKEKKNVPGIGTYNVFKSNIKGGYIDTKKPRFNTSYNGRPGVGEYDINEAELKLKKKTGISTNKAKRQDPFEVNKEKKLVPGIGSYNAKKLDVKGIYIREKDSAPRFPSAYNGRPGVGEYDINDAELKLKKKTGISTNKSKRQDPFEVNKESKNIPGTGAYNINIRESKGVYIEGKKERFSTAANERPGVGEYDINDAEIKLKKKTGISTSKSARKDPFEVNKEKKGKPGVGSYNINKTDIKGVYIEGNAPRFSTSNNGRPGVGEYDINDAELKLKKKTGISTNKSKRQDPFEVNKESKNIPGAGAYNTMEAAKNRFYIDNNLPRFTSSNNGKPGVGEYDINDAELKLKKKAPNPFTEKSKRKDPFEVNKEKKGKPGVGSYNINKTEIKGVYIEGNAPRFSSSNNGKPGVGEYDINDAELKLKKKTGISTNKSIRKDPFEVNKEKKNIPGTGAYNVSKSESNKFYIEQNMERFGPSGNKNPGVGEYDINDAELKLKNKTGISTNKSKRQDPFEVGKEKKNIPGAGAYNLNKQENNKFYIEQNMNRFGPSGNKNPGVGEYDINDASLKLKKKTGISTNKSKRQDPFEVSKESKNIPGTGAYNINKGENPKFYIEPKLLRLPPSGNKNPGVGEYDHSQIEIKLKPKAPEYIEPKAERKDIFENKSNDKVGPGSYEVKEEDTKAGMQKFSTLPRNLE